MIRSWFKIGRGDTRWERKKFEIRTRYKKDEESIRKMEQDLEGRINGITSFNSYMDKIEVALDRTLKVGKKMRIGNDNRGTIVQQSGWMRRCKHP